MTPKPKRSKRIIEKAKKAHIHAKRLHHDWHDDVYAFLHQPWRLTLFVVVMLLLVIVVAQLLYPSDRAVPFTEVQGERVGAITQAELAMRLQEVNSTSFKLKAGGETIVEAPFDAMGLTPQYKSLVEKATEYQLWQRFIPFSLFAKHWFDGNFKLSLQAQSKQVEQFVKSEVIPKCNKNPVSATINVNEGELELASGSEGRKCDEKVIITSLTNLQLATRQTIIELPYEVVKPHRESAEVERLFQNLKDSMQALKVEAADKEYEASREEVITWLEFTEDEKTKQLQVGVNDERIRVWIEKINGDFYIAPDPNRTALLDGQEQGSEPGSEGREINIDATLERVRQAILDRNFTVEAEVVVVSPQTVYERQYSSTDAGLEALLFDLVRQKGDYSITVIELDGKQRRANAYGSQQYLTASTYKIFVAYSVLKEMEAGRIKPGQHIRDGMDFEACWNEMLKYSLNPCSWTFADMVGGWARIEQQMHQQGLVNTYLSGYEKKSTSNDESLYFAKLERGELLQGASRERLLHTLKTQIYKSGIPAGAGYPAANKVGFYAGYLHDIGIVYAPQGRYVLGVMTYGGSWWGISDVARQVQEYLAQ